MNRLLIAAVAFVLWTIGAGVVGWQLRDGSADLAESGGEVAAQTVRAEQVEAARTTDHANAQGAAQVEQGRAAVRADSEVNFRVIEREVVRYVQANPDPAGCDLDGDGLRAWREANAGPSRAERAGIGTAAGPARPGATATR